MDFPDQNNLERICTLFDSFFFSGGAIPEGSFLCLALTTEAQSAKILPVEAAGKIVFKIHVACFFFLLQTMTL